MPAYRTLKSSSFIRHLNVIQRCYSFSPERSYLRFANQTRDRLDFLKKKIRLDQLPSLKRRP